MKNIQGIMPIILTGFFILLFSGLTYLKIRDWDGERLVFALILFALYMLWQIIESRVTVKEVDMDKTTQDKGTFEIYAAAKTITLICTLALPTCWKEDGVWMYSGVGIFISGVMLRLWSIKTLGEFYSHRVRIKKNHTVINRGPYSILRHPSYAGMMLAHLGFVLFYFNWIAFSVLFLIFYTAIIIRILTEEKFLVQINEYKEYSKNTKRLIPYIW